LLEEPLRQMNIKGFVGSRKMFQKKVKKQSKTQDDANYYLDVTLKAK
jgi:hypothetical protein